MSIAQFTQKGGTFIEFQQELFVTGTDVLNYKPTEFLNKPLAKFNLDDEATIPLVKSDNWQTILNENGLNITNTDCLIPVCQQGQKRSQVMYYVLRDKLLKIHGNAATANKFLLRPHGAKSGWDPYHPDIGKKAVNSLHSENNYDALLSSQTDKSKTEGDNSSFAEEIIDDAYAKMKMPKIPRIFSEYGRTTNIGEWDIYGKYTKEQKKRMKQLREKFSDDFYNDLSNIQDQPNDGLLQTYPPKEAQRRIFFVFAEGVNIVMDRLLECSDSLNDTIVISLPFDDMMKDVIDKAKVLKSDLSDFLSKNNKKRFETLETETIELFYNMCGRLFNPPVKYLNGGYNQPENNQGVDIFIKLLNGHVLTIKLNKSTDTYESLKQKVCDKLQDGTKASQVKLLYTGKQVRNELIKSTHSIFKESTLRCIIKPLSGAPERPIDKNKFLINGEQLQGAFKNAVEELIKQGETRDAIVAHLMSMYGENSTITYSDDVVTSTPSSGISVSQFIIKGKPGQKLRSDQQSFIGDTIQEGMTIENIIAAFPARFNGIEIEYKADSGQTGSYLYLDHYKTKEYNKNKNQSILSYEKVKKFFSDKNLTDITKIKYFENMNRNSINMTELINFQQKYDFDYDRSIEYHQKINQGATNLSKKYEYFAKYPTHKKLLIDDIIYNDLLFTINKTADRRIIETIPINLELELEINNKKYYLVCIAIKSGGISGGHWQVITKRKFSNSEYKWYNISDETVSGGMTDEEFLQSSYYKDDCSKKGHLVLYTNTLDHLPQPKGLKNRIGNNCWFSTALQIFVSMTEYHNEDSMYKKTFNIIKHLYDTNNLTTIETLDNSIQILEQNIVISIPQDTRASLRNGNSEKLLEYFIIVVSGIKESNVLKQDDPRQLITSSFNKSVIGQNTKVFTIISNENNLSALISGTITKIDIEKDDKGFLINTTYSVQNEENILVGDTFIPELNKVYKKIDQVFSVQPCVKCPVPIYLYKNQTDIVFGFDIPESFVVDLTPYKASGGTRRQVPGRRRRALPTRPIHEQGRRRRGNSNDRSARNPRTRNNRRNRVRERRRQNRDTENSSDSDSRNDSDNDSSNDSDNDLNNNSNNDSDNDLNNDSDNNSNNDSGNDSDDNLDSGLNESIAGTQIHENDTNNLDIINRNKNYEIRIGKDEKDLSKSKYKDHVKMKEKQQYNFYNFNSSKKNIHIANQIKKNTIINKFSKIMFREQGISSGNNSIEYSDEKSYIGLSFDDEELTNFKFNVTVIKYNTDIDDYKISFFILYNNKLYEIISYNNLGKNVLFYFDIHNKQINLGVRFYIDTKKNKLKSYYDYSTLLNFSIIAIFENLNKTKIIYLDDKLVATNRTKAYMTRLDNLKNGMYNYGPFLYRKRNGEPFSASDFGKHTNSDNENDYIILKLKQKINSNLKKYILNIESKSADRKNDTRLESYNGKLINNMCYIFYILPNKRLILDSLSLFKNMDDNNLIILYDLYLKINSEKIRKLECNISKRKIGDSQNLGPQNFTKIDPICYIIYKLLLDKDSDKYIIKFGKENVYSDINYCIFNYHPKLDSKFNKLYFNDLNLKTKKTNTDNSDKINKILMNKDYFDTFCFKFEQILSNNVNKKNLKELEFIYKVIFLLSNNINLDIYYKTKISKLLNMYKNQFRDPISDYNMQINSDKLIKNIKNSYNRMD